MAMDQVPWSSVTNIGNKYSIYFETKSHWIQAGIEPGTLWSWVAHSAISATVLQSISLLYSQKSVKNSEVLTCKILFGTFPASTVWCQRIWVNDMSVTLAWKAASWTNPKGKLELVGELSDHFRLHSWINAGKVQLYVSWPKFPAFPSPVKYYLFWVKSVYNNYKLPQGTTIYFS